MAKIAIYEAKNTPVEKPRFRKKVDHEIEKAEKELAEAYEELGKDRSDKAIKKFEKTWEHAQLAIRFAKLGSQ